MNFSPAAAITAPYPRPIRPMGSGGAAATAPLGEWTVANPLPFQPSANQPWERPFVSKGPGDTLAEKRRLMGKNLALAGGMVLAGLLLHKLPARNLPRFSLLSSDWKDWARIGLGIAVVDRMNKAMNWSPPPWLGALMAVGVMTPLAMNPFTLGAKKYAVSALRQMLVMAPIVAGTVQAASLLSNKLDKTLEERLGIPRLITRIAVSLTMIVAGIKTYPALMGMANRSGLMGAEAKKAANSTLLGGGVLACIRGCCPSLVCLSEIGEILGGLGSWFQSQQQKGIRP